jgi:hypothetical protein
MNGGRGRAIERSIDRTIARSSRFSFAFLRSSARSRVVE